MFKQHFLSAGLMLLSVATFAQQRNCAAMENLEQRLKNDPYLEQRMQQIEQHTHDHEANPIHQRATSITIPVVVHVLYNTTAQNISDAQINSQIAVLNADFAGTNADIASVPSTFTAVKAGDTGIRFCLAKRDPAGNATTGIIRKSTTKTGFSADTDEAKYSSKGGNDAWPAGQYLNLWVVPSITSGGSGGILGYAQFPGGAAATDGVVIAYNYFGSTGAVSAPYNKGRTATHEVGHWLNLRHIWGDANCGSDLVSDTPTHNTANYGCPAAGHKSTCTGTPVEMTMNYMDYTDDACMYMFSQGQETRMDALFVSGGSRASLLSSQGCVAPTGGTTCAAPTALSSSSVTSSSATVSWGAVTGATSYSLQYKLSTATTWTTVTTTATSYNLASLTSASTYNFQVAAVCSSTTSAYTASTFTTLASGSGLSYCASKGTSSADEYINKVVFGSINYTSGNNAGYGNFTNLSTNAVRGTSYTITITPGWRASTYKEGYKVWIDWNRDGDFLDTGENVFTKAATTATSVSGTVTVPTTASLGTTRMRVQMKYNTSTITSCETFSYGEVEDYTVNISATAREMEGAAAAAMPLEIGLFPNPTHNELNVVLNQFDGTPLQARVVSITGAEVSNFQLSASNTVIDVANLPAGMYFVSVLTADKQVVTQKFVKE